MLKVISLILVITLNQLSLYSSSAEFSVLQSKCLKCHGKEVDGKVKIKGEFDLRPLLNKKIDHKDAKEWLKIVDQIESLSMPPEDSVELNENEAREILEPIYRFFSSHKKVNSLASNQLLPKRAITSYEVMYSLSNVFNIDLSTFDPFENFHFIKDSSYHYPTINSKNIVSYDYFRQLEGSLDIVLDHYISPYIQSIYNEKQAYDKILKNTNYHPIPREPAHSHFVYIDRKSKEELAKNFRAAKELKGDERKKAIKVEKEKMSKVLKERDKKNFSFDIRKRGLIEIPSHAKNLAPGHYKLTITAEALNREKAKKVLKEPSSKKMNNKYIVEKREWGALAHEKAQLSIMHYGTTYDNRGWNLVPGAKRAQKVLASHGIDDNYKKEYVFEFTLNQPSTISMLWDNGPYSTRLNRLNLAGEKAKGIKEYNLPCIRIYGEISMTREPLETSKSRYVIENIEGFTEEIARSKLNELIEDLSLSQHKLALMKTFENTKALNLSAYERYCESIKWILMSPEFVYLDSDDSFESAARYASFSLLKAAPDNDFLNAYLDFCTNKISSKQFCHKVIKKPSFNNFITVFMDHWLEQTIELDEKKFSTTTRSMPFKEEANAYLAHLFKENKPVVEIFDSNFRVLSQKLTHFYGVAQGELSNSGFTPVEMKKEFARGGLLSQSAFFISQSDGVDPLPFKRAKWLVENIFGKTLLDPPNNIDTTIFQETVEAKTFKERTEIHAKHDACYHCHNKIDPYAFAMNNFNTDGSRMLELDKEAEKNLYLDIQTSQKSIARSFCKNLISFMTGRETEINDFNIIHEILNETSSNHYLIQDLYAKILEKYFKKNLKI